MNRLAAIFFGSALIYGVAGILLGLTMAATSDHSQLPTHAHLLVIGWLSFAVFGLFYNQFAEIAATWMARAHLVTAQASFIGLALALWLICSGDEETGAFIAAPSSVLYLLGFLLFAYAALAALRAKR